MTHPTRAELVEAMAWAIGSRHAKRMGGCFRPQDLPDEGECADQDCYCSKSTKRDAKAALTAAETLIPGLPALLDGTARVVPVKLLTEAHACMRATGWQLAPACDDGSDGVLNAAVAEIEDQFADILAASPTT